MALIQVPYYVPGDDSGPGSTTAYADPNTGKYYWDAAGNNPLQRWANYGDDGMRLEWVGTDPKTDPILSDPTAVKMLQSGYIPYEGLQNVYIRPDSGQIAVSPNTSGIDKIYGGFARGVDPQTGGVIIGDRSNSGAIAQRAVDYRNSIYTGGDWISNFLGYAGPAILMGGVGALAAAPAVAAAIPEAAGATVAPEIAAELAGLQASTTGLGSGIGAPSIVEQLVSNLPSVSTMAQNAAINAATQLATTGDIDPSKVLTSVVTGAAGTAVGSTVGQEVLSATDSALAASIASGAAKGALQAAITGADPLQTALASAAASGLGSVAQDAGIAIPQNVINSVVGSLASGQPLDQVLTGAAIAAGTGLARDAISSAYNAYNADQQASGLQAASDLGNEPVQGFDNNGNPIYRDSSGVWTNDQGVQVDPATGEPIKTAETAAQDTSNIAGGLSDAIKVAAADIGTTTDVQNTDALQLATDYYNNILDNVEASSGSITKQDADVALQQAATQYGIDPSQLDNWLQQTGSAGNYGMISQDPVKITPSIVTDSVNIDNSQSAAGALQNSDQSAAALSDQTNVYSSDTGALPAGNQILAQDQQAATTGLPTTDGTQDTSGWVSGSDLPTGGTTSSGTTSGGTTSPSIVTTTVPVSGGATVSSADSTSTGSASATPKASDVSTYIPTIPGYLRPTTISTGEVSKTPFIRMGVDPKLAEILTQRVAHGGQIHPRLMKVLHERGGELVPGPENRLYMRHAKRGFAVEGPGTGQSDDIPTMLSQDEYVIDADTVAALGDGSSKAGAEALDKMREEIRRHKRSAPVDKIPPKAKSPLEYLKMAKRK